MGKRPGRKRWVARNKRKKIVQIFVKVDGMKTVAMEVSPEDNEPEDPEHSLNENSCVLLLILV